MTKEDIDRIQIEPRGERRYWNITMFVVPPLGNTGKTPSYVELVDAAEDVLREAKGLGGDWSASNAEVMAWSSTETRGISTPYRFRVTLDMVTKDMEAPTDENV
jgi:hypothetical protein